ncbi:MAG: hypothetical protein JJD92_09395 [Frankiaceae bacterium]|nr:hypothetical protein [Frankiaceae bacterium]
MSASFATAAAEFVLAHGPLTLDQLHTLALEREVTRARTPGSLRSALSDSSRFVLRPDGRYDTAARLLAGCVFTTRPRRSPRDGVLWLNRDVDPLLALGAANLLLQAGGNVRAGAGTTPTWVGPAGWLPDVDAGGLLALRWDGKALAVGAADDVPAADSSRVHDVRRFLAAHALARHTGSWPYRSAPPLTAVVLSALVEDPALFSSPVPPLSELLPLPEHLLPQEEGPPYGELGSDQVLQVPLPERVHRELSRRAELLGDRLPQYVAMLLGAAADRVVPRERSDYENYDRYGDLPAYDNVIQPSRWAR